MVGAIFLVISKGNARSLHKHRYAVMMVLYSLNNQCVGYGRGTGACAATDALHTWLGVVATKKNTEAKKR